MGLDVPVKVDGKRKKIDIAIFERGAEYVLENIRRIVICDSEPKKGKKPSIKRLVEQQISSSRFANART